MSKKTVTESMRLQQPAFPMPRYRRGTPVQVYMGAGWSAGSVVESFQDKCSVRLNFGNKLITVFDARSIRSTEENK
jgi:hypothetical protein